MENKLDPKNANNLLAAQQIPLIGREVVITHILALEGKKKPALIHLEGEGGVGKTVLLDYLRSHATGIAPDSVIDLYHLENQSAHGLANAMVESYSNPSKRNSNVWKNFREYYRAFQIARDANDRLDAGEKWKLAEKSFFEGLNSSAQKNALWVFLDTLEIMVESDTDHTAVDSFSKNGLIWLISNLHNVTGTVIFVLAGRQSKFVSALLEKTPAHFTRPKTLNLNYLSEGDSRLYLQKTAEMVVSNGDQAGATRITDYLETWGDRLYSQTRGKPLRLAIVADILSTGSSLPENFYQDSKGSSPMDIDRVLVNHLLSLHSPLSETLRALSYLRKGADDGLMALLLDVEKEQARDYLIQAGKLTLVKSRPGNFRRAYFLHDEIYDLFARHKPVASSKAQEVLDAVDAYYGDEISEFRYQRNKAAPDRYLILEQMRISQIEQMHYALWFNELKGYARYFALAEDALHSSDDLTASLAKDELKRTLKLKEFILPQTDEFKVYLQWDEKIRKAAKKIDHDLESARQELGDFPPVGAPEFVMAYWRLVRARIAIKERQGAGLFSTGLLMRNADVHLKSAVELIQKEDPPQLDIARQALLAYVNNYQGYEERLHGQYHQAIRHYQESSSRMRKLGLDGLSGVLINQAYAMSILGKDRRGLETVIEAYEIAKNSNDIRAQARAMNVMSSVVLRQGNLEHARSLAMDALKLHQSKKNADARMSALILLNVSISCRSIWGQWLNDKIQDWKKDWAQLLPEGLVCLEGYDTIQHLFASIKELPDLRKGDIDYARQHGALDVLKTCDTENWVYALTECGMLWREVAWVLKRRDNEDEQDLRQKTAELAVARLCQACGITDISKPAEWQEQIRKQIQLVGGSPYWPLMALVNLGWHYNYQYDSTHLEKIYSLVEMFSEPEYIWPPKISPDDAELPRWVTLGKMEMLRGFQLLRNWDGNQAVLEKAVRHISLALEYNYLMGQSSYDFRRAEAGLEDRLRSNRNWETELLPGFYKAANAISDQLRQELNELSSDKDPRILRWLEERFGDYGLWQE